MMVPLDGSFGSGNTCSDEVETKEGVVTMRAVDHEFAPPVR